MPQITPEVTAPHGDAKVTELSLTFKFTLIISLQLLGNNSLTYLYSDRNYQYM